MAITASPVAAAVTTFLSMTAGSADHVGLVDVSAFVKSQAATLTIMLPFGMALGLLSRLL